MTVTSVRAKITRDLEFDRLSAAGATWVKWRLLDTAGVSRAGSAIAVPA
jgi:hypothetical protein